MKSYFFTIQMEPLNSLFKSYLFKACIKLLMEVKEIDLK